MSFARRSAGRREGVFGDSAEQFIASDGIIRLDQGDGLPDQGSAQQGSSANIEAAFSKLAARQRTSWPCIE